MNNLHKRLLAIEAVLTELAELYAAEKGGTPGKLASYIHRMNSEAQVAAFSTECLEEWRARREAKNKKTG